MSWTEDVLARREVWARAPSAHNTQPWVLTAEGDRLLLSWDPARELVVADPTRRDLWLSLGALAESVVITAADAGHDLGVTWAIDARRHRAAVIDRHGHVPDPPPDDGPTGARARFSSADLLARRCARGPYLRPFAAADQVARLATDAQLDVTATTNHLGLSILPGELVGHLLAQADRWSYSTPAQVDELRRWLRLGAGHPAYEVDGLSGAALALSMSQERALRVALSPRVWPILSRAGGPALLAAAGREGDLGTVLAVHAPSSAAVDPAAVAESGRMLLRVWLAAARQGLHVHPVSQLIDAPVVANEIHAALPLPGRRALSAFRIGVPARPPVRSARR